MGTDENAKARAKAAIEGYYKRTDIDPSKPVRHHGSPERDVQDEVIKWLRSNGFSINVVESKATFDLKSNRYIGQSVKQGFVDLVGNYKTGLSVFIELKAPGRRYTLRDNQRKFLLEKINSGCFAVCVDSVMLLKNQFERFMLHHSRQQFDLAKEFLLTALPPMKVQRDTGPLFD